MPSPEAKRPPLGKEIPLEQTHCVVCGSDQWLVEARGTDTLYQTSEQEFTFVACCDCGHIYLNPRPAISAIDLIYPPVYSSFTGRFSKSSSTISRIKDRVLLARLQALRLDLPADSTILDIGCGDGSFLVSVRREYPEARLIGLDWKIADQTQDRFRRFRIEAIESAVELALLPVGEVDLIVMNQLIEHLWQPSAVLESCRNALKCGGWLALETPNPDSYDRRWWFRGGLWGSYYFPRHLNLFSQSGLTRFVSDAGFEVVKHMDLLAPLCWVYTVTAYNRTRRRPWGIVDRIIRDTNPLILTPFAAIDWLARCCGLKTSNQKLLVRKPRTRSRAHTG
jgi:SAM-dependent methyltransferase